jgi:hypothetical protein
MAVAEIYSIQGTIIVSIMEKTNNGTFNNLRRRRMDATSNASNRMVI